MLQWLLWRVMLTAGPAWSWTALLFTLGACGQSRSSAGKDGPGPDAVDVRPDAGSDASADRDGGASTDAAADPGAESESAVDSAPDAFNPAPMTDCEGGKLDPGTNLCWQDPPSAQGMTWPDADKYCSTLDLGGHTDWRLPGVDEIRSLIRPGDGVSIDVYHNSCSANVPGGACQLTAKDPPCLTYAPCVNSCGTCQQDGGPGTGGCYWDKVLSGACESYWTSTERLPSGYNLAWCIDFSTAGFFFNGKDAYHYLARCVRNN